MNTRHHVTSAIAGCLLLGGCATGAATSTATTATATGASQVLTRTGIGGLRLGMTIAQVRAMGVFGSLLDEHPTGCASVEDPGKTVVIGYSAKDGVYMIGGEHAQTPEGIGAGSTLAQIETAYPVPADPTWAYADQYQLLGDVFAQVPGNPQAEYVAEFHAGKVTYVFLKAKAEKDC
jgi:hypothetical protein